MKFLHSSPNDKIMIERAKKLYTGVGSSKDYEGAYKIFWPLANSGNAEAARYVGLMKFSGKGTKKSLQEAKQWLSVAAQKGDELSGQILKKYETLFK